MEDFAILKEKIEKFITDLNFKDAIDSIEEILKFDKCPISYQMYFFGKLSECYFNEGQYSEFLNNSKKYLDLCLDYKRFFKGIYFIEKFEKRVGEDLFFEYKFKFRCLQNNSTELLKMLNVINKRYLENKTRHKLHISVIEIKKAFFNRARPIEYFMGVMAIILESNNKYEKYLLQKEFLKTLMDCVVNFPQQTAPLLHACQFCVEYKKKRLGLALIALKDYQDIEGVKQADKKLDRRLKKVEIEIKSLENEIDRGAPDLGEVDLAADLFDTATKMKKRNTKKNETSNSDTLIKLLKLELQNTCDEFENDESIFVKYLEITSSQISLENYQDYFAIFYSFKFYNCCRFILNLSESFVVNIEDRINLEYLKIENEFANKDFSLALTYVNSALASLPLTKEELCCFYYLRAEINYAKKDYEFALMDFNRVKKIKSNYRQINRRIKELGKN